MGENIQLTAADGHRFDAYQATPDGNPRGGLVVIQEVFGLTDHIKRVTDRFAEAGYLAIAPALFDRVSPGIILSYDAVEEGRDVMLKLDLDESLQDIAAAAEAARTDGKVAAVGYCWGGAMADLAACRLALNGAAAYYGGRLTSWLDLHPQCPVLYHFGGNDALIPMTTLQQIRAGRPEGIMYLYPEAGHGFNCEDRADFHPDSAGQALDRTLTFLASCI
ncbi:MAG: dienelactone hydrolase family protein [Chromatiales bacterium]|nr:MAG: dienelactone hydrolase family protein [Chromatiales bacterium]